MRCALFHIGADIHACCRAGCGRVLRIESTAPATECRGQGEPGEIPPETKALADRLAAAPVIGLRRGPGFELKAMLLAIGHSQGDCGCAATEAKMNRWGVEECRRRVDELAREVVSNAKHLGVCIVRDAARTLVLEACRRAELHSVDDYSAGT